MTKKATKKKGRPPGRRLIHVVKTTVSKPLRDLIDAEIQGGKREAELTRDALIIYFRSQGIACSELTSDEHREAQQLKTPRSKRARSGGKYGK